MTSTSRHSRNSGNPVSLITDNLDVLSTAIKKKSSAGRGSNSKLELYGIKKLRELILDLAVRGLLVPQDPNDEPASVLLEKIAKEKAKLIKAGKIKKQKPLSEICEDEKPFELPEGWEWVRLNEVGYDWGQKTPDSVFTYIDVGAINKELGFVSEPSVLAANEAPSRARKIVKKGTVIYSTVRPYLLNIAVINEDFKPEPIASTAFAIIHPFDGILASFVYRYLRSPAFISYVESCQTGIAYPAVNDKQFFSGVFPLPPLDEQHRIVAKVDELMALCDQLEQQQNNSISAHETLVQTLLGTLVTASERSGFHTAWTRIAEHFHTLFTTQSSIDQLKQTLLQLAVMGKLVPQDPNDEPASVLLEKIAKEKAKLIKEENIKKQKSLPEIGEHEKPFELPVGWEWCNLGGLVKVMDAGWSPACDPEPSSSNDLWGVLKTTSVQVMQYLEHENKTLPAGKNPRPQYEVNPGDILITRAGPKNRVGISCLVEQTRPRLMISDKIIRFHLIEAGIYERFISLCLNAGATAEYLEAAKSGMAESQMNISQDKLRLAPIPLCPASEQYRIVAKVDELMALCDTLKARLNTAQTTQLQLADCLAEQALA